MKIWEAPRRPPEMGAHKKFFEAKHEFPAPRGGHKTFNQVRRISPRH